MTSAPHLQFSGVVDNLLMAAQMQSIQPSSVPYYARESPQIPTPKNKSELELYQLLKRANLIDYFPTFVQYGGDDVEQLAEANEDEFLEIVELIGMHKKPLHVWRLQKALSQWRTFKMDTRANDTRCGYFHDTASYYAVAGGGSQPTAGFITNLRSDASVRSDRTQSSVLDESIGHTSTTSRSLFPVSSCELNQTTNADNQQQQYCTPHEIIRNAPKRPRLMDSIKPSDLTKGIQMYDSSVQSTPARPSYSRGRGLKHITKQRQQDAGAGGESSLPTTPIGKAHHIQISPPDSAEPDSDESSDCAKSRSRPRRKAVPSKSK